MCVHAFLAGKKAAALAEVPFKLKELAKFFIECQVSCEGIADTTRLSVSMFGKYCATCSQARGMGGEHGERWRGACRGVDICFFVLLLQTHKQQFY